MRIKDGTVHSVLGAHTYANSAYKRQDGWLTLDAAERICTILNEGRDNAPAVFVPKHENYVLKQHSAIIPEMNVIHALTTT